MLYSICVATDFEGTKVNLQFFFDSYGPTVAQVLTRATEAFNVFFRSRGIQRLFTVTTAVIFNEMHQTWDRLERSSQLVHNGQIYLFQPDVVDVPAEIPDPINGTEYLDAYESPQRLEHQSPGARMPSEVRDYRSVPYESPAAMAPKSREPREGSYRGGSAANGSPMSSPQGRGGSQRAVDSPAAPSGNQDQPTEQDIIRAFQQRSRASPPRGDVTGDSILQDERRRIAEQSSLTLDEFREVARAEAREFTPSPSRERY